MSYSVMFCAVNLCVLLLLWAWGKPSASAGAYNMFPVGTRDVKVNAQFVFVCLAEIWRGKEAAASS